MASTLVVGTVAYDSVESPFGKVEDVLGGSATYSSIAASFFTQVALVACVGRDFRDQHIEVLKHRGVDLDGLEYLDGKTFRWKGEYGYDLGDARTLDTQLNVLAGFRPKVPDPYRSVDYVFLANVDPVLQRQVLSQLRGPKLVACDTMQYWIQGHFESLLEILKQVDILTVNEAEARQITQEANLVKAARKVLSWGPETLIVKRGEHGVLMFQQDSSKTVSTFAAPAYPLEDVFDPTGAGDSFAGGFMGYLAGVNRFDAQAVRQGIIFGSVMASFCVERFSLDRLKELTFTEIELRYKEFKAMTHFDDISE